MLLKNPNTRSLYGKEANYNAVGPNKGKEDRDDKDEYLKNGDESSGGSDFNAASR
ncbi:hypothetical protein K469DRAFT_163811 [Zopfia rhizophila CBS 207.26]|uniref:Uncharacterized protein n=1 Tax=Zopfia rhizophila CBS 207.26 TaxID=1314779 RepID=A0A6A6E3S5_9PEZI|nr:hypothetical protein K469DRAFT_163811 [Zopfia rhizophila CBS 207.26]